MKTMKKSQLTKILIEGNPELLAKMAEQIEVCYDVFIESGPEKSLVMVKNQNSVTKQRFYSGEVLVTECKVSLNGNYGLGVIMGEKSEQAYQLAVVDAACNAQLPETNEWLPLLEKEAEAIKERHLKEANLVAGSKVNFDTMEDYHAKG